MPLRRLCLFLLPILLLSTAFSDTSPEKNKVTGRILLPGQGPAFKRGGAGYCDEGPKTTRRQQLEGENHPNRHVIVSLVPLDFEPVLRPTQEAVVNQQERTFVPKVLAVTKGSTVEFVNSDAEVHNVFSRTQRASFNIGRRQPGKSVSQLIGRSGIIELRCDIHCHMSAAILSLETPYFTKADAQGNYVIDDLPDGRYRMEVYHFDLGTYREELLVRGGGTIVKNVDLSRP